MTEKHWTKRDLLGWKYIINLRKVKLKRVLMLQIKVKAPVWRDHAHFYPLKWAGRKQQSKDHFLTTLTAQPCTIKSTQTETFNTHSYTKRTPHAGNEQPKKKDGIVEYVFSSVKYKTQLATHTADICRYSLLHQHENVTLLQHTMWTVTDISSMSSRGFIWTRRADRRTWDINEFYKAKNKREGRFNRWG